MAFYSFSKCILISKFGDVWTENKKKMLRIYIYIYMYMYIASVRSNTEADTLMHSSKAMYCRSFYLK